MTAEFQIVPTMNFTNSETLETLRNRISQRMSLSRLETLAREKCSNLEFVGGRQIPKVPLDRSGNDPFYNNLELLVAESALARGAGQHDLMLRGYTFNGGQLPQAFWSIWETNFHPFLCTEQSQGDRNVMNDLVYDFVTLFWPAEDMPQDYEWFNNNYGYVNLEALALDYSKTSDRPVFDRKGYVVDPEFWAQHISDEQALNAELEALNAKVDQDRGRFNAKVGLLTIAGLTAIGATSYYRAKGRF
jgi:hypothetical protein